MEDFWNTLLKELLKVSEYNLSKIQDLQDGSIEAMNLLVEAAESYHYLQQAYENKQHGDIHVGIYFAD